MSKPVSLKVPATSANLGPGFDALGLAMQLYLQIQAETAETFSIEATGRDAALVGSIERNLMLETYRSVAPHAPALRLRISNAIPLGMGCGSSAAALVAGVLLANHFGKLDLSDQQLVDEASRREGHPDNVAACFHGGLTCSAMQDGQVSAATLGQQLPWRLLLALPGEGLATTKARALLPESYTRAHAVENVQSTALLVAAFALNRADLLRTATRDRLHQDYRSSACPLFPKLLPLAGTVGIYSVTLSGAGPSVLLIAEAAEDVAAQRVAIAERAGEIEILETGIANGAEISLAEA